MYFFSLPFSGLTRSAANHGFLGVLVVRVPANAHHHFVHVPITEAGPAIVDPSADVGWKIVHHRVWEVGWRRDTGRGNDYENEMKCDV